MDCIADIPLPELPRLTRSANAAPFNTAGQGSKLVARDRQGIKYTCEARSSDQGCILRIKNFDPGRKRFHSETVGDYPLNIDDMDYCTL